MKLFKLIASAAFVALGLTVTANAQRLPKAHTQVADANINLSISNENLFEKAVTASRETSLIAKVDQKAETSYVNNELATKLVDYAAKFLGTRYVWGATGPSAFDCSGFTSYVYRNIGINLNRTSSMQFTQGEKVSVHNLQPGDLMFFSSRRSGPGNVGHVAIVASVNKENNTCTFIHASTKRGVVYQTFPDNGYYSQHFVGAKRILGSSLDVASR